MLDVDNVSYTELTQNLLLTRFEISSVVPNMW